MAVGFTPKHIEELPFSNLSQKEALALVIKTAEKSGWQVNYASKSGIIAYTTNGMLKWNAEVTLKLKEEAIQITSASIGSEMIDWGKNKKTVQEFIIKFDELKANYSKEELQMQYLLVEDQLPPESEDELTMPPATKAQQFKDLLSIFIPVKGFFVTPILLNLNIMIFIMMALSGIGIFSPETQGLIDWGANFKPLTLEGEWWRLITCCFIHIGIIHLVFNMYALISIGVLLEPILGTPRFIVAYLLTGLTASMTSLWWHDLTVSAGASGAIFGMYGLFLALLTTKLLEENARKSLLTSIAVFVGYNLLFGINTGVDNAAHIGGLISGLVIGYALIPSLIKNENKGLNYGSLAALSVVIIVMCVVVFIKLPNDIGAYDKNMEEFMRLEERALTLYKVPNDAPTDTFLSVIQHKGIPAWEENIKIIERVQMLNLPDNLQTRNQLLKEYCKLRLETYKLIYKAIATNTDEYRQQIDRNDARISKKIDELNAKP